MVVLLVISAARGQALEVCSTCAYHTVGEALVAAVAGDIIEITDAAHEETATVVLDRALTLRSSASTVLTLRGSPGISVTSADVRIEDLVLDPDDNKRAITASGVTGLALVRLTLSNHFYNAVGGGFFLDDGTEAVVDGCTFSGNTTNGQAGAIYVSGGSSASVSNSHFETHTSTGNGAAILVGADANLTVTESTFLGNHSDADGGAISVWGAASALSLMNNVFENNTADDGAAVHMGDGLSLTGAGNRFCEGQASGGIVSSQADSTTWSDNTHREGQETALLLLAGTALVHDNDFLGNTVALRVDDALADVRSNLFAFQTDTALYLAGAGSVTLAYNAWWSNVSDVSGLAGPGDYAVTTDPLVTFTSGACGEAIVRDPASPLIGAGDPALPDPDIGAGTVARGGTAVETADTGTPPTTAPTTGDTGAQTPTDTGTPPTTSPTTPDTGASAGPRGQLSPGSGGGPLGCACSQARIAHPWSLAALLGWLTRRRSPR